MFLGLALGLMSKAGGGGAVPETQPYSFTLTTGEAGGGILIGYQADFDTGDISRQPLDAGANTVLDLFYSRTDNLKTTIQFDGQQAALLLNYDTLIDGVPIVWETDWTEVDAGEWKTAAEADGILFSFPGTYEITWQPR